MADILLTHGYFLAEDEKERQIMKPYPPLGLLYLSAFLKRAGFAVEVFDSTFEEFDSLARKFAAAPGGVVGIYTNLMTRRNVLRIVRAARLAHWTVVLGGPESANYVDEYLEAGAQVIVTGEGEVTLAELLNALPRHGVHRLQAIAGLAFRDETGAVVRTGARARVPDIDTLPFPDREAIDHDRYLRAWKSHHGASSINLITARGCAYRCDWCSHAVYGHSHRRRSPANVADEMQWIIERYDPDQVWYADDVFTISHPWLARYTDELRRRGIHRPFETITRADRLQNEDAAALLRELGCFRIWIGSESGSQKILDAMQRGVKVDQVRRSCRLARAHGIQVGMFLMWGYEGEEIDDIAATVEHVKQSNPDVFFTTVSYPIKGTGYFEKVRDKVELPLSWQDASDRDYVVAGRPGKDYYKLADQWLRNEVEAYQLEARDPARAAELSSAAARAREALRAYGTPR
jgi:anaerobic magnesium-protoporphyrin IX monomethyl ester cyclase